MADVQLARGFDQKVQRLESAAGKYGGLTGKQQRGLALILTGCAMVDVARRVGVSRGTVYNWTHGNERFMAALESWQRDMAKSARVRLLAMSGLAARAITTALEKGDAKVALAMFKALGVMDPLGQGEPEEERIIFRRAVDRSGKAGGGVGEPG
jgi:hypothetical protein